MRRARLSPSQVMGLALAAEEGIGGEPIVSVAWPPGWEAERRSFAPTGPPVENEDVEVVYTVGIGGGKTEERVISGKVKRVVVEVELK